MATVPGPLPPRDSVPLPAGFVALTTDGTTSWGFGLYRFGLEVARVEFDRFTPATGGVRWSPDSKKLLVHRDDLRGVRIYPLYSSTSNQPVDHSYFYAAPGDSAVMRYKLLCARCRESLGHKIEGEPIGALESPSQARWGKSSDELYVVTATRGLKAVQLARLDLRTGSSHTIVRDSAATFVDMNSADWAVAPGAKGGEEIFWVSERDGWGHLYRYARDGTLENQVEHGSYKVADIVRIDSARAQLYFTAWGKEAGSPHYTYLYRANFDGSGMTLLSPEPGNHTIRVVPRAPYFIDTYSQIATPPVTVLRDVDGKVVMELAHGDDTPLRAIGWTPAEVFTIKARDGKTDLWGILHKPSTFDPNKHYPMVTYIYPGPQRGSVGDWVFKGPDWVFGTTVETRQDRWTATRNMGEEGMRRTLAELGFIVIQLDALGSSPQRSKAFEDFFYGHVSDNGLPDQIAAIRQLAARYPWMDTTRVGVVGHSAEGIQPPLPCCTIPTSSRSASAGPGITTFRVYGWYWGEKYQGPYRKMGASDTYEAEANYKYAGNLKGKLLLMTGDALNLIRRPPNGGRATLLGARAIGRA
jgi:dipeptidyl-peptidase-4